MRKSSIVLLILISLTAVAFGQTDNAAVEKEIQQVRQKGDEARKQGDTQAVSRLLADDFLWLGMQNFPPFGKSVVLASRPEDGPSTKKDSDLKFRVYGETVIVTGMSELSFRPDGTNTARIYFTEVWIKRQGQWQIASMHTSPIAPQPTTEKKE